MANSSFPLNCPPPHMYFKKKENVTKKSSFDKGDIKQKSSFKHSFYSNLETFSCWTPCWDSLWQPCIKLWKRESRRTYLGFEEELDKQDCHHQSQIRVFNNILQRTGLRKHVISSKCFVFFHKIIKSWGFRRTKTHCVFWAATEARRPEICQSFFILSHHTCPSFCHEQPPHIQNPTPHQSTWFTLLQHWEYLYTDRRMDAHAVLTFEVIRQ